jgi:hypothetical protein
MARKSFTWYNDVSETLIKVDCTNDVMKMAFVTSIPKMNKETSVTLVTCRLAVI